MIAEKGKKFMGKNTEQKTKKNEKFIIKKYKEENREKINEKKREKGKM